MSDYQDININRHGGNKQSNQANVRVSPKKSGWRERILVRMIEIDKLGRGVTLEDLCYYFGKEKSSLSGRLSELHHKFELIEPTGEERNGFAVYRLKNSKNVPLKSATQINPG